MHAHLANRSLWALPLLGTLFCSPSFAKGGEPQTIVGPSTGLFGETVGSRFEMDAAGKLTAIELLVPMNAIKKANRFPMTRAEIEMPRAMQSDSLVKYMTIDWNPAGHDPASVYGAPHFDFHFFFIDKAAVARIDCTDMSPVPQSLVPSGYTLPPLDSPGACVPLMGFHAVPQADLQSGHAFASTPVYGYYEGQLIFFEPMVTLDLMLKQQSVAQNFNFPAAFAEIGAPSFMPTDYRMQFDPRQDSYRLRFELAD